MLRPTHNSFAFSSARVVALLLGATVTAQVPDGYVVFGSFQGTGGVNGIFFAHPRDTSAPPIAVSNLPPALAYSSLGSRGVSALLRRPSDGALVAAERAPAGTSVDVHILRLSGANVVWAQSFSAGTSYSVGEIPQCALLPDERIVVAASDLTAGGALSHFNNGAYHWQGLAILDTNSGAFAPIVVPNWSQFLGVINGLAVSRDGSTVYLGAYIGVGAGALWAVPTAGGTATVVASLPFGASNVAIDQDDTVLVTTLNGPPNLFRYDPLLQTTTPIATSSGPLNAIAVEPATGNFLMATGNAGTPARSIVWQTPTGPPNVLMSPNLATIAAIDSNPNPESYGQGTPAAASYRWLVAPNPGGLPEPGNFDFALTLAADQPMIATGLFVIGYAPLEPVHLFGVDVLVDPSNAALCAVTLTDTATLDLPLPADPAVIGIELYTQAFLFEYPLGGLAASPGLSLTIL